VSMNALIINVPVPGHDMQRVSVGQEARIASDFLPDREFKGHIKRLSPVVDPESGTFKAVIEIDGDKKDLKPGMFVTVRLVTDTHRDVVLLPKRAVVFEGDTKYVFVVRDRLAHKTQIREGFTGIEELEVTSGLKEGETVVVVGQIGLKDKSKVRIVEDEDKPEPDEEAEDKKEENKEAEEPEKKAEKSDEKTDKTKKETDDKKEGKEADKAEKADSKGDDKGSAE